MNEQLYNEINKLRKKIKKNNKCMMFYYLLKEKNKNDTLYSWLFVNDGLIEETLEELEENYNKDYIHSILSSYKQELQNIIDKSKKIKIQQVKEL